MSLDFLPPFCLWLEPIWTHDKQGKLFSNSVSISPKYSNFYKAPRWASCGVHHSAESWKKYLKNRNSAVCIKPWSQTAHCGVRIDIFESLSLLLKRQSGKILLWVNKSIMKEKIWRTIFWFAKPKILTLWCHAHQSRIFRTLRSTISDKSKLNLKILYPVHQGPIWVRIMRKMEVENLVTHSL